MPVTVDAELQELPYDMASRVAYDVMHDVFAVHNEFGRFMDENIYRDEIAQRVSGVRTEVLIEVTFRDLQHTRLESIHWINMTRGCVTFRTLNKERTGR